MSLIIGNHKLVLQAFTVLADAAPSNADLKYHLEYIKEAGKAGYVSALNDLFTGYSDVQLAKMLLETTGLDGIDLEGDGNTDNMAVATAFIKSNAANRVGAILDLVDQLSKITEGPLTQIAKDYNNKIASGYAYASNPDNTAPQSNSQPKELNLTKGADVLTGSSKNDVFNAWYNQLNDGDVLDGGAGNDTLKADIYAEDAITPITKNIENVLFRSQYKAGQSSTDNNMGEVKIDAQRMKDVTNWESNNSRADLLIEDVRINNDQITKDITITMRETDPGHVDYGVYFDQYSLRNVTNSTSRINIQILDTRAAVAGEPNLKGNADWGLKSFNFFVSKDGGATFQRISIGGPEVTQARTVEELREALQKAADKEFGVGGVNVTLGAEYTVTDTKSGLKATAKEITLTAKGDLIFDATNAHSTGVNDKAGWTITNVPSDTGLHSNWNQDSESVTDLVTSTVVLDDVGRGSTGGDLVIGGLSVGDTSSSKGVGRFEITVEDDSTLRKISSTNDTLQEVTIKNGVQDRQAGAYNPIDSKGGKLVVKGDKAPNTGTTATPDAKDATLPSGSTSEYGFQDVRLIDGSAMTGKLEFNAEITQNAVDKYLKLRDTQAAPLAEDVSVAYTGGSNNDKMWVNVNQVAAASNSKINPGKADFNFKFEGGAGNDEINVAIDRAQDAAKVAQNLRGESKFKTDLTGFDVIQTADLAAGPNKVLEGANEVWYHNQRSNNQRVNMGHWNDYSRDKMVLSGGAGDDVIVKPGAGDTTLDGGTGADVIYADNTGAAVYNAGLKADGTTENVLSKAIWAFGTRGNETGGSADALRVTDAQSVVQKEVGSWGVKVQVNYRGLKSVEVAINDTNDYKATQLDINQAIKKAINEDPVLSKLLVAQDGPGASLFVQSKVDDVHSDAALQVTFKSPVAADLSADIVKNYNAANGTNYADGTALAPVIEANVAQKANAASLANAYNTKMAKDAVGTDIKGAESVVTSDNIIKPGVDNDADVIVLGTDKSGANELLVSNDIVKFEGVFGHDTIVNFNTGAAAAGGDRLDFRAFFRNDKTSVATTYNHGVGAVAGSQTVTEAKIETFQYSKTGALRNDTAEEVKKLYTDTTTTTTVDTELYMAVEGTTAHVYKVTNGTAANDLTVELLGQLDLAGGPTGATAIDWNTLRTTNFV